MRIIGQGPLRAFTVLIRPFFDRLDVTVKWLFFSVPDFYPTGPATVFTDRFWDDREHFVPFGVGVVPNSAEPYFGEIPTGPIADLYGTDDEWERGLSYTRWIAGDYPSPPCVVLGQPQLFERVRQAQAVRIGDYAAGTVAQAQSVQVVTGPYAVAVEQVQAVLVFSAGGAGSIEQVQAVEPFVTPDGLVEQVQAVEPFVTPDGLVEQVQAVEPFVTPDGLVEQVQAVEPSAIADGEVSQVQAVEEV